MEAIPVAERAADPRPARTRAAIYRAVLELATRDDDISVNAIVRLAGVSRSSFYAQFSDIDELAIAMLIDTFREIGVDDVAERSAVKPDARAIARHAATRLVEHIDQRRAFYRASLDWRVSARVRDVLAAAFTDQVAASMAVMGDGAPAGVRGSDEAVFIGGGAMSLMSGWLRDPEPVSPAEMAERLLAVMPDWLVGTH